jgi:hypothetical protein
MYKLFVLIVMFGLVFMSGCNKREGDTGETKKKNGAVSKEVIQPSSKGVTKANPETKLLEGGIGSSSKWGSGWLDLASVTDFAAGDILRLRIGGTASKVLVRLLPEGSFPDSSVGIVGSGAITVPKNRIVEVALDNDRKGIIQISVHGGPNPWGSFPLGEENGPATLESATIVR